MSGFGVVHEVGRALKAVLVERFHADAAASELLRNSAGDDGISLAPPEIQNGVAQSSLSLWLYLVSEQEHTKNRPPTVLPDGRKISAPLALSLYYLVTPGAPAAPSAGDRPRWVQAILGKVLQVFHTVPIIALVDPEAELAEELHVALCRLTLEELTRIWDALGQPYQLSVCYRVNVARVRHLDISRGSLIVERDPMLGMIERPRAAVA
jgi:hypothetical protein